MKISYKCKDVSFSLPLPLWLVDLIPTAVINIAVKHNAEKNKEILLSNIDFSAIKKSLHVLKNFKGLNLLELKSKNGDEIVIKV